ncbi:MAG: 30S ribosomal protein S3 [Patescibacteria group bacterium]
MTHHVHPYIFRIGQLTNWKSRWFDRKNFAAQLREDVLIREWLEKKLRASYVEQIECERSPGKMNIIIRTSRPGMIIGRGGDGVERLKSDIQKRLRKISERFHAPSHAAEVKITVEEVRQPESHAGIVGQMIADDIERRLPFRRAMRTALQKVSASLGVEGVKIALKGRLGGAEMARYEWVKHGRIPLQTMRANVDYASRTAYTTYGTVGIKVWIYKGMVFGENEKRKMQSGN